MIMGGLPPDALSDPFKPPDEEVEVECIHCGKTYSSDEIAWRNDPTAPGGKGFWCCPMPGCDGIGFNFDIHPLESLLEDDDEDDEFDEDECDE